MEWARVAYNRLDDHAAGKGEEQATGDGEATPLVDAPVDGKGYQEDDSLLAEHGDQFKDPVQERVRVFLEEQKDGRLHGDSIDRDGKNGQVGVRYSL